MAKLTYYAPVNMFDLSLMLDINALSVSSSVSNGAWTEKLDDGGTPVKAVFTAVDPANDGFKKAPDGSITGGLVKGLDVYDGTLKLYSYTDINLSTDTVWGYIALNDDRNFMGALLSGADSITGSDYSDDLWSFDGNDTIDGGSGQDTLEGGFGNDTYYVDNVGDLIREIDPKLDQNSLLWSLSTNQPVYKIYDDAADLAVSPGTGFLLEKDTNIPRDNGSGIDTAIASVDYSLPAWVERLTLSGNAAVSGTGNSLNNVLRGNSANNTLTGGEGSDVLQGGKGADTLDVSDNGSGYPAEDRIVIGTGHSTTALNNCDKVLGYQMGEDALDMPSTIVAGDTAGKNGTDDKIADGVTIKSHRINNGLIQFDDQDTFASPITINDANLGSATNYLSANIGNHAAVAFIFSGKTPGTYVFSDSGSSTADNLVLIQGVSAAGLSYIDPAFNPLGSQNIWIV
jgi:hypothetical protein